MNMLMNNFDILVDSMLEAKVGSCFCLNSRIHCKLNEKFSAWRKDNNSSSVFSEAHVDAEFAETAHEGSVKDGLVVVQKDMSLSNKYYVSFFAKDKNNYKWQNMFSVAEIDM